MIVGRDLFYFASARSRRRFAKDPLRYCKILSDPVTGSRFTVSRASPHLEYHGRHYYFSGDSTLGVFNVAPDRFALRARDVRR